MNIIAVVNDEDTLPEITAILEKVYIGDTIKSFIEPLKAQQYGAGTQIDIAFISFELQHTDGLSFAESLRELCPNVKLIFITTNSKQWAKASCLHNCGYLRNPATERKVRNLRIKENMR